MARIPDAEIERVKQEVSLARLIEGLGDRQGSEYACCVKCFGPGADVVGGIDRQSANSHWA